MNKKTNKQDFGKGIRALLANPTQLEQAVQENPVEVMREFATNFAMIPLDQIEAYSGQPRQEFNETALEELAASIRVHGIIQPLTVRRLHDKAYQLISGERRFRASKLAGLTEVPAYVRLADDQQMLEMALIENIQREDLNPIEIAISYARLIEECKLTHENLSDRVGKQRSTITNYLRLMRLPDDIKKAIKDKKVSMGHARALVGLNENPALQHTLFHKIMLEELSVRAVEDLISRYNEERSTAKPKSNNRLPDNLRGIQDQFRAFFGAKVDLKRSEKGKGQIVIKFESDAELNRLIDLVEHRGEA
ncbi:MAG: ParB/RepB/Spo0J family partition protein [Chitinophagales bacterium]|jgi:ParB family transcriptional regulator, chromosome partitioning protein|nr:ParB/RepB/Spo0J family partition protein [Chitinophagales bacterium]